MIPYNVVETSEKIIISQEGYKYDTKEWPLCCVKAKRRGEEVIVFETCESARETSFNYEDFSPSFKAVYTTIDLAVEYFNHLCDKEGAGSPSDPETLTNKTIDDYTNHVHADAVHHRIKCVEAGGILKGQAIAHNGWNDGENAIEVIKADNSVTVAIGLSDSDLANGDLGMMTLSGTLENIDTSSYLAGTILYVNGSGDLTEVEPTSGFAQPIAFVLRAHAVNGDVQVLAAYPKQDSSDIRIGLGVGSPTIKTLQGYIDSTGSSGFFNGGEITDGIAGTINIAEGEGFIRNTASSIAPLLSFKWLAVVSLAIPIDTAQYIFVSNAGVISIDPSEFLEEENKILIGVAVNEGGTIVSHFNLGVRLDESIAKAGQYIRRTHGIVRDNRRGGLIFSETGTRNVVMNLGYLWWGRTEYQIPAIDTSAADTFSSYSQVAQVASAATQWDNTQYDNAGVITTMTNNRWANLYFYLEPSGELTMVYGRTQYTSLELAEAEAIPTLSLPAKLVAAGVLASRFTFQKGAATATISSAFLSRFAGGGSSATEFATNVHRLNDPTDPTKQIAHNVSGGATGTVLIITLTANANLDNIVKAQQMPWTIVLGALNKDVIAGRRQSFRMIYTIFKLGNIYADCHTAPAGDDIVITIMNGATLIATVTIDDGDTDSSTSSTPAVISVASLLFMEEFDVIITTTATAGQEPKVYLDGIINTI